MLIRRARIFSILVMPFLDLVAGVSSTGPGYTLDYGSSTVYAFDLETGSYSSAATLPGDAGLGDIALLNSQIAYVLGFGDSNLYAVDLVKHTYSLVTPTPIGPPSTIWGVAIANDTMAYLSSYDDSKVYSVNLLTGASSILTTISGDPGLTDIVIANNTTAYVVGYNTNQVYRVNLETGAYSQVTSTSIGSPGNPATEGITLANSSTAYVAGNGDANIYVVDLQNGSSALVTASPITGSPPLANIGVTDNTGYTVNNVGGQVYSVNLLNGSSFVLTTIAGANLTGMGLLLQMPLSGLTGNNLKLANYLNANAPIDVVRSFALLNGGLGAALESAAPTRNAFTTYAAQNGYLASSQAFSDHTRGRRFQYRLSSKTNLAFGNISEEELLATAFDKIKKPPKANEESACCMRKPLALWVSPFGEYAREKAQHQTPAFSMGLGGAAIGFDNILTNGNMIGLGGSYIFTHIHEDEGAGHANINQGYATLYGTINIDKWYFDLGVWGGYYSGSNQRKISFPGVNETAKSQIKGWQFAPHFEVGYDGFWSDGCSLNWFGLEPFFISDWVANWEGNVEEHGAGSFNMGQKKRFCSLLRCETGLRFHEIVEFNWGRLVFREKGSYAYQKTFHTGQISAFLIGSPSSFTVTTLTGAQNLGVFEFSMLFISSNLKMPYLDIKYQGEFGSQYQSHQGILEIGKEF